jgi:hypothetical protein
MKRPLRELEIPDDLWAPLGELAVRLGIERDALVRQALHAFLRFHGGLPGDPPAAGTGGRAATARRVLDTATELERSIPAARATPTLRLVNEAGVAATVTVDRFLVGRGRHCDLVIEGAKVSREHVAIQREPDGWWIEDLGSSNGTWLGRARIERRHIEDGDEYLICSEKIRCLLS